MTNFTFARNAKTTLYEVHVTGCAHLISKHLEACFAREARSATEAAAEFESRNDGCYTKLGPCAKNATDTPQQKRALRSNKVARWVRKNYSEGTRVVATPGAGAAPRPNAMHGLVLRHVPGLNAQGGHLVVRWDNGITGNVNPGSVTREVN